MMLAKNYSRHCGVIRTQCFNNIIVPLSIIIYVSSRASTMTIGQILYFGSLFGTSIITQVENFLNIFLVGA